ncbi:MAG: hypothetical protein HN919_11055 [Verrucomicrobia bacterium]|jgi:hypothetical protein|nr:hypothetical protein [Verrucomicrobiota bacterium]MBT7066832.1 hypothetical protein [Verrucomicrobiota bacterium]MBT7701443.1 hypothetical protein [Verrucomicrobiota bacterium]
MTIRLIGQLLVEDFSAPRRNHLFADPCSTHSTRGVGDEMGMSLLKQSLAAKPGRGLIGRLTTRFGAQRKLHRCA